MAGEREGRGFRGCARQGHRRGGRRGAPSFEPLGLFPAPSAASPARAAMFGPQKPSSDPRIVGKEMREAYQNLWQVPLLSACMEKPGFCCFAMLCAPCASYSVRKQLLYHDMRRYICCGGACPCSGRLGEESCPEICLGLETLCCFAQSVATSRFMIQDEMLVQTTKVRERVLQVLMPETMARVAHSRSLLSLACRWVLTLARAASVTTALLGRW